MDSLNPVPYVKGKEMIDNTRNKNNTQNNCHNLFIFHANNNNVGQYSITICRVDIDCCNMGKSPILSLDEENKLVKHLLEVAKIGYGYNRKEIVYIASDYTVTLGKRTVYGVWLVEMPFSST
jgi:hypothetical protein